MPRSQPKTQKDKKSFNLIMTNIGIGIFKNHPSLAPLSSKVSELGYELFCVERAFNLPEKSVVHPELISCSTLTSHSVIAEWTTTKHIENKLGQLLKYSEVTTDDLRNYIAVPANSAIQHSVWLVVPKEHSEIFRNSLQEAVLSKYADRILLSSLENKSDYTVKLTFHTGCLRDKGLEQLFLQDYVFEKVPKGYLRIVTSDLGVAAIMDPVLTAFAGLLIKSRGLDVNCRSIAEELFGIWSMFDSSTQIQIIKAIDSVFKSMHAKGYAKRILRKGKKSREWGLSTDGKTEYTVLLRRLRSAIERFTQELDTGVVQIEIWDLEEEEEPIVP